MTEPTPQGPKSLCSILLFLALSFLAFAHCLVFGKSYFANDLIYSFCHFRLFEKIQLAAGHFPLWNPYLLGGQPFFADPTVMLAYPLNYLTLIFPTPYDFGVFFFLHMFLAAWGMHFWLRSLRVSEGASRVGAILFSLSGLFWWELIHPTILASFAWFPWWMGSLEKLTQEWTTRRGFLVGLIFAVLFLGGNFQMASCYFYTGALYFLYRGFFSGGENPTRVPASWRKKILTLLFALWGVLPLLVQLIPTYELSRFSERGGEGQTYEGFNGQFSMRPNSSYEFLFPSLGVPRGDTLENAIQVVSDPKNSDNAFLGAFGFLGIWAPFLALLAFRRKEKRLLYFLLGLGALSILAAWGRYFPLHQFLCAVLPGLDLSRAPFRFIAVYVSVVCVLAAYGFQSLEKAFEERDKALGLLLTGGAFAFLLLVIAFFNPNETWREILGLVLGVAGLFLWGLTQSWKKMGQWVFGAGLFIPLFLTAWSSFSWGPPSNFDFASNFPIASTLKSLPPESRFLFNETLNYAIQANGKNYRIPLPQDTALSLGLRSCDGYVTLSLKKTIELRQLPFPTYIQLMGVRAILIDQYHGELKGLTHRVLNNIYFYEADKIPEPASAPTRWSVIPDDKARLAAMGAATFDPAREVFLSADLPPGLAAQLPGKKAQIHSQLTQDALNQQTFRVQLDQNSLVVFSEVMFPGWKAKVDGKPAELFTGNHLFRTLFLPAGEHQVEFSFEPVWLKPILLGFLLWLVSAVLYAAWLLKRRAPQTHLSGDLSGVAGAVAKGSAKPEASVKPHA